VRNILATQRLKACNGRELASTNPPQFHFAF
jgi:hypothetical protein